jgi:NAD(P)-dependent dehydrogenase (short-subunit alcohol dehydrogenase family)
MTDVDSSPHAGASESLAGQVAWITGGGSGIGLAGAIELARAGCRVVISGRDAGKLQEAAASASSQGVAPGRITAAVLDVGDRDAVEAAARAIQADLGRVDILVNSAGVNFPKRHWTETDSATFDRVLATNLHGAAYCTLAVVAGMRSRGQGTVINVSSFAGWHFGYLTGPAYTASKAGMIALSHSFNIEEGAHGLRSTALCPGEAATPILKLRPVPPTPADRERMLQEADLGRAIKFIAELPPHVCVNELVITPVFNRSYIGRQETRSA